MFNPVRIKLIEGEILSSFIIRSSIAAGTDPLGFSGAIWPEKRVWTLDIDRAMSDEYLLILSKTTGTEILSLQNLTLNHKLSGIFKTTPGTLAAWDWITPISSRNRSRVNGLHYCPDCIKESPTYFRLNWRIAWNVACDKHGNLLNISCPKCNTVISPHLINYLSTDLKYCVKCQHDMTDIERTTASIKVIKLQKLLNDAIDDKPIAYPWGISDKIELFATINALTTFVQKVRSIKSLAEVLFKSLGTIDSTSGTPPNSQIRFINQPILERHFILLNCAALLEMPLKNVMELFQEINVRPSSLVQKNANSFSDTFDSIYQRFEKRSHERSKPSKSLKIVKPRTKDEVDKLWNEIQCFL
jgi:Zn ribbon nucleic-acid-binding protein